MRIDLAVRGEDIAANRLREFAAHAENAETVFRRIARILMEETRSRFDRQGPGWAPLDPDTIRQKAHKPAGATPGILRQTGTLERALTVWGAPGQRLEIGPDELVYGLEHGGEAYYGAFAQRGDSEPARPFLKKTERTRRRVREALLDHLLRR